MADEIGTVVIKTEIDANGAKAGTNDVVAALRRAAGELTNLTNKQRAALNIAINGYEKQANSVDQIRKKIAELEQEYDRLKNTQVETDEFKEVKKQIEDSEAELIRLQERMTQFLETGGSTKSRAFKNMEYQISELENTIYYAQGELQDMLDSGTAYTNADTSDIEAKITAEKEKLNQALAKEKDAYDKVNASIEDYRNKQNGSGEKTATAGSEKTAKNLEKSDSSMSGMAASLGKVGAILAVAAIGVKTLTALVKKLRTAFVSAIKEGLNRLVLVDDNVNKAMSTIMSASKTIQNALASAFSPILVKLTPIIEKVAQKIVDVINLVAEFIAYLSGQSYYNKAIMLQEDYAESLQGTADAAKEADKNLSGLDELHTWQSDKSSGSNAAAEAAKGFEKVNIDKTNPMIKAFEKLSDILKTIRSRMKDIAEYFQKMWASGDNSLLNSLLGTVKSSLDLLKVPLKIVSDIFIDLFDHVVKFNQDHKEEIETFLGNVVNDFITLNDVINNVTTGALADLLSWWEDDGRGVFNSWLGTLENIAEWFMTIYNDYIHPFIQDVTSGLQTLWDDHLEPLWRQFLSFFGKLWENVVAFWNTVLKPFVDTIINRYGPGVLSTVTSIWRLVTTVVGVIADLLNGVLTILGGLLDFLTGVFTLNLDKMAQGLYEIFGGIAKTIVGAAFGILNVVVSLLNTVWAAIYAVIYNIVDGISEPISKIGELMGKDWGISKYMPKQAPLIPTLSSASVLASIDGWISQGGRSRRGIGAYAAGAVIPPNAPFLGILGDQKSGTNIETPEKLLRQIMREELGGGSYQFVAQINRKTIFDQIVDEAKLRKTSTGKNPLLV